MIAGFSGFCPPVGIASLIKRTGRRTSVPHLMRWVRVRHVYLRAPLAPAVITSTEISRHKGYPFALNFPDHFYPHIHPPCFRMPSSNRSNLYATLAHPAAFKIFPDKLMRGRGRSFRAKILFSSENHTDRRQGVAANMDENISGKNLTEKDVDCPGRSSSFTARRSRRWPCPCGTGQWSGARGPRRGGRSVPSATSRR